MDLQSIIQSEYYKPINGFNANNIYLKMKPSHPSLTKKQVKYVISKQETNQVFRHPKRSQHKKVVYNSPFSYTQIDLMDFSNEPLKPNRNYKFLFCLVDIFSKIAFAVPIKNKSTSECVKAMKQCIFHIWNEYHDIITVLQSDNESAFLSKPFQSLLTEYDIVHQINQAGDHQQMAFIESFNRNIRQKIKILQSALHTNVWVDFIPDIISSYNNTVHSSIKNTPIDSLTGYNHLEHFDSKQSSSKSSLKKGDKVRLLIRKNLFDKGTTQRFTSTVHTITKIESGNRYFVNDRVGSYKDYELQLVSDVQTNPNSNEEHKSNASDEAKDNTKSRRTTRRVRKEGIAEKHNSTEEELNQRALRRYKPRTDVGPYINY